MIKNFHVQNINFVRIENESSLNEIIILESVEMKMNHYRYIKVHRNIIITFIINNCMQ